MPKQWYYQLEGRIHGPVSRETLHSRLTTGSLATNTLVIREGMTDWLPAHDIRTLVRRSTPSVELFHRPPTTPPPPRQQLAASLRTETHRLRTSRRTPQMVAATIVVSLLIVVGIWAVASTPGKEERSKLRPNPGAVAMKAPTEAVAHLAEGPSRAGPSERRAAVEELPEAGNSASTQGAPSVPPVPNQDDDGNMGEERTNSTHKATVVDSTEEELKVDDSREEFGSPASLASNTTDPVPSPTVASDKRKPQPVVLYQELNVQRQPKLWMLGTVMAQNIHYQIVSQLTIQPPDENGLRDVQQVVQHTRLVKADDLSRGMFDESLRRLVGWQFAYTLNARNEVIEMRGPVDGKRVADVAPAAAKGFLMTSVMDEDGWKELAEWSFFAPDPVDLRKQFWTRQMTHDFDELGSWSGVTTFVPHSEKNNVLRVEFTHKLNYHPPAKGAAAGHLPFAIKNAEFKVGMAGGKILFDTVSGRVSLATELFHVRGQLTADALGQVVSIPVEETQAMTVRVLDQNPWQQ